MAARKSRSTRSTWAQKVRSVISAFPASSLSEIKPRHVISVLKKKYPTIEISNSKRVAIAVGLKQAKSPKAKIREGKIVRRRKISSKEPWEIALWILKSCGRDFETAQKNLREAKKCLTKIKRIELRSSSVRNAS
jgi:hypothetical protein